MKKLGILFLFSLVQNCSVTTQNSSGVIYLYSSAQPSVYFSTTTDFNLEIYYESGAEPYVGQNNQSRNLWSILQDNLEAALQYKSKDVTLNIPTQLNEMTDLGTFNKSNWKAEEIIDLHAKNLNQKPNNSRAVFYIYFLNGYFHDGQSENRNVIGVNLSGTPVVAMFKAVIRATGANPNGWVPRYVEQSTLVHEMGHALGLVNNGIPLSSQHQDKEHGAHTLNEDCVMYWQNEGASGLASFVQKYIVDSNSIMWGPEVLKDVENFSQ